MKSMNNNLSEWLSSVGVVDQFTASQLQSGRTVISLLRSVSKESKIQLVLPNSAINRVNNWNNIIQELKKISIKVTQEEKGKIVNGNHDSIFTVISKIRQHHQKLQKDTEISVSEIDPKRDPKDSASLLELLILIIMKNFSLTAKESIALLSNQSKYLAHILAKGLKGQFRPIQNLIADCGKHLSKIFEFSKNQQNKIFFLKSIKPALICKSEVVAENCLILMLKYTSNYDAQQKMRILTEQLINTLILIIKRHPQLSVQVMRAILVISEYNFQSLALINANISENETSNTFLLLWGIAKQEGKLDQLLKMNQIQPIFQSCILGLRQSDTVLSSLHTILEIGSTDLGIIVDEQNKDAVMSHLASISLSKQAEVITFTHQCFAFLSQAGDSKHPIAPQLFKYILNEFSASSSVEQCQLYLINFGQIVRKFPSIPFHAIIETINQKIESGILSVAQIQLQFFRTSLQNPTAQLKMALIIYNLISRALIEGVGYSQVIADILLDIIVKFKEEDIVLDMTIKLVKVCLAIHFANVKKMTQKRKSMSLKSKLDPEESAAKAKNSAIQYFVGRVVEHREEQINSSIQALLCFSYIQVKEHKEHAKGLQRIIRKIADFDGLIAKYQKEMKNEEEEEYKNSSKLKNSKLNKKNQSKSPSAQEESGFIDISPTKRALRNTNSHPMSLSFVGVGNDAQKGMQKYQKIYLKKIQNIEQLRMQQSQKQQRTQKLKKVLQKQMLTKGIGIKGMEDQIDYIFEFDSKQRKIEDKHNIDLIYYSASQQEERDIQALEHFMKKYDKLLKFYFSVYSGKKSGFLTKYFQETGDTRNYVHSSNLARMLKDNGLEEFINLKEIQHLTKRINYNLSKDRNSPDFELLDYQGFKEFLIQSSFTMFTRPPKDMRGKPISQMIEQTLYNFKLYAAENKINPIIFEDPEAGYFNEGEAIKILNRKLAENPDYILPEGYKKIVDKKVSFQFGIFLEAMSLTYKEVYEVLDEILSSTFKFHIIQPFTKEQKTAKARPNVYFLERAKATLVDVKMSVFLKKQITKLPIKDRQIAKEAASCLEDITYAVEFGHDQVGLKHENATLKAKKQKQEEQRRLKLEEERKRVNQNRQLKSAIEQHKQKKESDKEAVAKVKRGEIAIKKQQKQKRQKRQKQLKLKIDEYNLKRKQDEEKEQAEKKLKLQAEKQQADKKKQLSEELKKKIQEAKKKKQQEEAAKKQKQKEEQKKKKQQEKRKFQQSQRQKKQKVEEYKEKKNPKPAKEQKVMDQKEPQQQAQKCD